MQKAREVSFPGGSLEVKIMLPVALFGGLGGRRDCMQNDKQTAQKQTSRKWLSAVMIPARWSAIRSGVKPNFNATCQIHR